MSAFSLVELLVVIAIIGMMVGLSALAVSGMRAPGVQRAASQVMSGLSLARQIAITKNTYAAFLIAHQTNAGFPSEPFSYWSVVYSNKSLGNNTWTIVKDWEQLPDGAFFFDAWGFPNVNTGYSSSAGHPITQPVGQNFSPSGNFNSTNFTTINAINGNNTTDIIANATIPYIRFNSEGIPDEATSSSGAAAIRVAQGTVLSGNATLTSTNHYFFIETDRALGRIRLRKPESYTTP
jgi:prepilin-type N-terminal cleavage/methylation domain-containing protein